jgi:hypothetical protein
VVRSKVVEHFKGKAHTGQAKVEHHKASGNVTAQSHGAKGALNLTAMYKASTPPSKVPSNGAPTTTTVPQSGGSAGSQGTTTVPQSGGSQGTTTVIAPTIAILPTTAPTKPEPTATERLADVRTAISGLKAEVPDLLESYGRARGRQGLGLGATSAEIRFLGQRDTMQAKIGEQLASVDTALKANPDAATRKALEASRHQLIQLSLTAEFPKSVTAALQPFQKQLPEGATRAMTDGGAGLRRLDKEVRDYITSFHPKPDGSMTPRDPQVVAHLSGLIESMQLLDSEVGLNADETATLGYLKELHQAVELIQSLDSAVTGLEAMRERFKDDKDLSKVSMGRLCREISHFAPTMHSFAASDVARNHSTVLGTIDAIVHEMARNVVPDVFVTEDEGVKKMMGALRKAHCENLAATKFIGTLDLGTMPGLARALADAQADGRPLTVAQIKQHLTPEHAAGLDAAVKKGQVAAENREAYFSQMGRVARALGDKDGSGAMSAYKPGIWLKVGGAGQHDLDGARAIEKLKALGRSNPQAAFQVANLAVLEHRVALSDRDALGLPWTDRVGIATFDPQRVLDFAGITTDQMVKLGYSRDDAASFPERLQRLAKNFDSVSELREHIKDFARIADDTLTNRGVQQAVGTFADTSGSVIGKGILNDVLSDVSALGKGQPRSGIEPNLTATSQSVVDGFTAISGAITRAVITDDDLADSMELGNATFAAHDTELVTLMRDRAGLEGRIRDARADLQASSGPGSLEGLDLNPDKPAGLRSAKAILEAIRQDNEITLLTFIRAPQGVINDAIAARDAALESLRGFDAETMRKPWTAKISAFFGQGERPDISALRSLRAVAENIVFLREGAATEMAAIDTRIGTTAQLRSDLAASRMEANPEVMGTARQMIRAAILANWPGSNATSTVRAGHVVDAFEPSAHRDKIEATLRAWGMDIEAFAPELSVELNGTLSDIDLKRWREEAKPIDRATGLIVKPVEISTMDSIKASFKAGIAQLSTAEGWKQVGLDTVMYMANKKEMDDQFKADIFALSDGLRDGEKYDFRSGLKVSLNTGKIPVEPTATVGVRGKMAVSGLSNFIIERSGENIKVTARTGGQVQVGAEIIADQRAGFDDRLSAGMSAGVDLTGGYMGGKVETFPNTEVGRKALSAFLLDLVNGEEPSAESFEHLSDAATQREYSGKVGVNAKVYAKAEFTTQPLGDDGDFLRLAPDEANAKSGASNKVGIGFTSGAEVAASLGGKIKTTRSANKVAYESEAEVTTSLTLSASSYLKMPTLLGTALGGIMMGSGAQQSADDSFHSTKTKNGVDSTSGQLDLASASSNEQLLGMDIGASLTRTRKAKQEYSISSGPGAEERLSKAEVVSRSNLRMGPELAMLGIGSAELSSRLDADPQFKADYDALKAHMGVNDSLQITYGLKADKVARINDMMLEANDHARNGDRLTAFALRGAISRMLLDETNFEPTKISVFSKTVFKDVANRGNAVLARIDIVSESAHEEAHLVLNVPPKKA